LRYHAERGNKAFHSPHRNMRHRWKAHVLGIPFLFFVGLWFNWGGQAHQADNTYLGSYQVGSISRIAQFGWISFEPSILAAGGSRVGEKHLNLTNNCNFRSRLQHIPLPL